MHAVILKLRRELRENWVSILEPEAENTGKSANVKLQGLPYIILTGRSVMIKCYFKHF